LPNIYHILLTIVSHSHRAKSTQNFLKNVVSVFISSEERRTHSPPDINPLDYSVWDILQERVHEERDQPYANLHELRKH